MEQLVRVEMICYGRIRQLVRVGMSCYDTIRQLVRVEDDLLW